MDSQEEFQETFTKPRNVYVGHLIGKRGRNIRTVERAWGVKIEFEEAFPSEPEFEGIRLSDGPGRTVVDAFLCTQRPYV